MRGTFLLGVGAQKAGTTWLYSYLKGAPNVRPGFTKEYHVWDAITIPACHQFRVDRNSLFSRRVWRRPRPWQRWWMQRDTENYFNYFSRRLARSDQLTFDITPSYSGLSAETFAAIRKGFEDRDIRVKVVFLLRDPFERCWSSTRMQIRNYGSGGRSEEEALTRHYLSQGNRLRTRYDETITRLEGVLAPEDIHIGDFERLFRPEKIAALSHFLNVPERHDLVDRTVNVSPKTTPIDPSLKRDIVLHFREVYEFCFARDPSLRNVWNDPSDYE